MTTTLLLRPGMLVQVLKAIPDVWGISGMLKGNFHIIIYYFGLFWIDDHPQGIKKTCLLHK